MATVLTKEGSLNRSVKAAFIAAQAIAPNVNLGTFVRQARRNGLSARRGRSVQTHPRELSVNRGLIVRPVRLSSQTVQLVIFAPPLLASQRVQRVGSARQDLRPPSHVAFALWEKDS